MGPVLYTVIFVVIWWVVLFAVLPWGVRHDPDVVVPGSDPGAPSQPMLWRKAGITTAIAALLWFGLFLLIHNPPPALVRFLSGGAASISGAGR